MTTGNLADNDRAFLFLIDYAHQRRVKLWGRARTVQDPDVVARLMPENYGARPEQAILFTVSAWDIKLPAAYPAQGRRERGGLGARPLEAERDRLRDENAALKASLGLALG